MKVVYIYVSAWVFLLAILSVAANAQTCVSAECHLGSQKYEFLHGPAAAQQCTVCHTAAPDKITEHTKRPKSFIDFRSPVENGPVCTMCHNNQMDGQFIHKPVENGDCTSCHNPHGGDNKFFVNGKMEAETCFQCHEDNQMNKAYLHGPVGAGECASCHDPHSSDHQFQLKADKDELCYTCHGDRKEAFNKAVVHEPVKEGCTSCHDPHGSEAKFHLNSKDEETLCFNCHAELSPEVVESIQSATYKHDPVQDGKCGDCHNPHASEYANLLRSDTKILCFECHQELGDKVLNAKFIHGPVSSSGCEACHNVHGSKQPFILHEFFPKKFYNGYIEGTYKLCFECHDQSILESKTVKEETNFRNGDVNLHSLHVKIKGKGRSCKACHEVHASKQPVQIRKSVPFGSGGWELPVKFTKTQKGGTCVVGCHKPKTYNRAKAYKNP